MSDRFRPLSTEQLARWVFTELADRDSVFNVPRSVIFMPRAEHRFRTRLFGVELETPFGVAAGPHTQMAQNIVAAWLVGARLIELKTVQTLDELEVHKPCIDIEDEGYNVEWSQELRVHQSFDEYLRAWVLIHALHHRLGFPGPKPGVVFNMSVGYNLEGIRRPNVQWYLDAMADASAWLPDHVDAVARWYPAIRELEIPSRLSDSVTLSTMHGCPPDEIERISSYLLEERGLHTTVKCNPTLLGADQVRQIVRDDLGYRDVTIPDAAFGHDLTYTDAVPMFRRLRQTADDLGLAFGLKLSNTLEVENGRPAFDRDATMYMSGRALHAVTVNLASKLTEEFRAELPLSFAGGADAFNVPELLRSGLRTITVCSDLLKTGGFLRMLQYPEQVDAAFDDVGALDTTDFACRSALAAVDADELAALLGETADGERGAKPEQADAAGLSLLDALRATGRGVPIVDSARAWGMAAGLDASRADGLAARTARALARLNLRRYAADVRSDWRYRKDSFRTGRTKSPRALGLFDCVAAPCVDTCPVDQAVPAYMRAVRDGDIAAAARIVRSENALPTVLGSVCDHLCEGTCVRTHLDQPLAIRHIKRFVMESAAELEAVSAPVEESAPASVQPARLVAPSTAPGAPSATPAAPSATPVAIVGAGPAGLAAARDLARASVPVTIFEARDYAGGMVGGAIPDYRLAPERLQRDIAELRRLGVEFRFGTKAGRDFSLEDLRRLGFGPVFVAVGAQLARRLGLPGEDAAGVVDGVTFLRSAKEGNPLPVGARVGVVGAGDTAMDCARTARRLGASAVSLIYRRSIDQMPADPEEIRDTLEEGIDVIEHASPAALHLEGEALAGIVCRRTAYAGERDTSGRKVAVEVPGSEFEIGLDMLIVAVSQHAVLDFFGAHPPTLTPAGYVEVDPVTLETSLPGVYAGGDVAAHGPASIVRAAADGRRVARAIAGEAASQAIGASRLDPAPIDMRAAQALAVRRARRQYRVPIRTVEPAERRGFEETVLGFTPEEARREAARCLDCDTFCSLCVSVCPNMALLTYAMEPRAVELPGLRVSGGEVVTDVPARFAVEQGSQVAVLADLCNECGTCVTACPTAGRPYRDKPRLYVDRADFEAEASNAFLLVGPGAMEGRFDGQTHRIDVDGQIAYRAPGFEATLDPASLALISGRVAGAGEGAELSLEPAAILATLLQALERSAPHLPAVADGGTFVAAPTFPLD